MKDRGVVISFLLVISTGYASAFQVCVQKIPNCKGTDLDCSRSVPCYHGNCTLAGSCSCQHCWSGQNCDQYVDNYLPKFFDTENSVRLTSHDTGILYTVNGLDEDGMNTCRAAMPCPCSEMKYSLTAGNKDDLFQIDSKEGDLYLRPGRELQPGSEYNLVILVESVGGDRYRAPVRNGQNEFRLNLIVSGAADDKKRHPAQAMQKFEDGEDNYFQDEENEEHVRSKRAAASSSSSNDTSIQMNYTDTISSVLNVGDKIDLIITVLVPEGVTMDLTMEVFTSDPENQNAAYALCDISVMPLPAGVSSSLKTSTITPTVAANTMIPLINDHAVMSFGNVTGTVGSPATDRTIVLTFSAVLVGTPYVVDGGNYSIVAGTSYANETYIWVAAATFTANVPPDPQYYGSAQTLDGPSNIASNGYGIYDVSFFSSSPWSTVKVDVFSNLEPSDTFSTGGILVTQMGTNFHCTNGSANPYSYTYVGQPSASGLTISHSKLVILGVINCDDPGTDRQNANASKNLIGIRFLVFVPPNMNTIGSILSIGATITINEATIWTNLLNITIDAEDNSKQATPTMTVLNTTVSTSVRGVTTILVNVQITETKYANLILQALAPKSAGANALISFCTVTATGGINIPMIPSIQPNITSSTGGAADTMTADFGRVWNTAMIPGNTTAGTVTIAFDIRVEEAAANGQSISIQLVNSVGVAVGSPSNVLLNVDSKPQNNTETQGIINIQIDDVLNVTGLAIEGDTLVEMTVSLSNGSDFGSLNFEVMASLLNQTIEGRVCRAAVSYVGRKIPCINPQTINSQVSYSSNNPLESDPVNSLASMELGSVCLSDTVNPNTTEGQIVVTAAIEIPRQLPGVTGTTYTLFGGIKLGQSTIWAGSSTYSIIASQAENFPPSCLPTVTASLSTIPPAIPGMVTIALIQIKIPPTSQSVYTLTLTATAGDPFAICQLSIQYLGYNFPCVDPNPKPGNTSRVATTRLNYDSYDVTMQANKKAILDFGAMSNLGNDPFTSDLTPDKNTIIVAATLKIDATASKNLTLAYSLKYKTSAITSSLVIPMSTNSPPSPPTTTNVTITPLDGDSTINVGITKVVALDFMMPQGPAAATKVVFNNPNSASNDFVFCSAAVTKVGMNIPCLNASSATLTMDNTAGNNCSNSLQVNLGTCCSVQLVNDPNENWIRVEVAVNILNTQLTSPIEINAIVNVGSMSVPAGPLNLAVDNSHSPPLSNANLTAIPLTNTTIEASIGSRTWVDFNLTVPYNSTMSLQMTATGASANGRAIMTVTGIRVSAAGINVACIKNTTIVDVQFNSSATVTTQQNDVAAVDFGFITNTGMTYRRGFNQPWDDQITISIEVLMTDHPSTNNNAQFSMSVLFDNGNELFNVSQLVTATRNMTEVPDITVQAQVLNPKLFQKSEVANVYLILSHTLTSTAEPVETLIRLYLPNYVTFTGPLNANVTIAQQPGSPISFLLSDAFYFDEYIGVNFSLVIDPNGIRDPGSGIINATSIGRVFAKVTIRNFGAVQYPTTTDYLYAGKGFYWIYGISGGNCHNPLGMQNGAIHDCQLTASATVSSQYSPSQARLGNAAGKVWKPAVRNGIYQNYIQVDFGNRTRVSQVSFQKDTCCRAPSSIIMQYSDQGIYWTDGYSDPALNYTGDTAVTNLAIPFEGRMLRIIINGTDQPESAATMYVGVKLEFFGCTLTTEAMLMDICNSTDKTIFSTDVNRYRHFSVDSNHNAVYACDIQPNSWTLRCFCSEDGVMWKNIPNYITNIIGYNAATGFTYGRDSHNATFFKSADCLSWLPANATEVAGALSSSQFTSSVVVPGLPQNDPGMTLTTGSWTATFDGLYLSNSKRLGWS